MIESFGSPTLEGVQFEDDGNGGVQLKKAGKQAVKFYVKRQMQFRAKTDGKGNTLLDKKTGLPPINPKTGLPFQETFENRTLMVIVNTPGDKSLVDSVATEYHKREYFRQYKFFKDGKGIPDGHSIDDCDFIPPQTLTDLHYYGVHILEQLAECSDLVCEQVPAAWDLRDYAKEWLRIHSPDGQSGMLTQMRARVEELERERDELKAQILGPDGKPVHRGVRPSAMEVDTSLMRDPVKTMEISPDEFKAKK